MQNVLLHPLNIELLETDGASPRKQALSRLLHHANARLSILVTLLGIVTLVRFLQPLNADSPILATLLGIVTSVRPWQL